MAENHAQSAESGFVKNSFGYRWQFLTLRADSHMDITLRLLSHVCKRHVSFDMCLL